MDRSSTDSFIVLSTGSAWPKIGVARGWRRILALLMSALVISTSTSILVTLAMVGASLLACRREPPSSRATPTAPAPIAASASPGRGATGVAIDGGGPLAEWSGEWRIVRTALAGISAVSEELLRRSVGNFAEVGPTHARFGTTTCAPTMATTTRRSAAAWLDNFKTAPAAVGISSGAELTVVDTDCEASPISSWVVLDSGEIVLSRDGAFYFLRRVGPARPMAASVGDGGERRAEGAARRRDVTRDDARRPDSGRASGVRRKTRSCAKAIGQRRTTAPSRYGRFHANAAKP